MNITNQSQPQPVHPRIKIDWEGEDGRRRIVEVEGTSGFVKYWISRFASSALEKPIDTPPPSPPAE